MQDFVGDAGKTHELVDTFFRLKEALAGGTLPTGPSPSVSGPPPSTVTFQNNSPMAESTKPKPLSRYHDAEQPLTQEYDEGSRNSHAKGGKVRDPNTQTQRTKPRNPNPETQTQRPAHRDPDSETRTQRPKPIR
jgi:hypothetical protein